LVLRAFAFSIDGDVGYIIGGYTATAGADDGGKFVLALRRNKRGRWLIAADIDNTNNRRASTANFPDDQKHVIPSVESRDLGGRWGHARSSYPHPPRSLDSTLGMTVLLGLRVV
jgi:hypothetical protein